MLWLCICSASTAVAAVAADAITTAAGDLLLVMESGAHCLWLLSAAFAACITYVNFAHPVVF
jgi:hypothetical protein